MLKKIFAATAIALAVANSAYAEGLTVGSLTIENPAIRATVPGAKVAGGYMTITNNGTADERLTGGDASFARKTEIHEMKMEGEVMKMQAIQGGLVIPAGETVRLAGEAGIKLTPAGATFPYGRDPRDRNIRIAPTMPSVDEINAAMDVFCTCVELAAASR